MGFSSDINLYISSSNVVIILSLCLCLAVFSRGKFARKGRWRRTNIYPRRAILFNLQFESSSGECGRRVQVFVCAFTSIRERERDREGNRRKTNRGGSTFGGWKRNLREVSIADIRANWFSFLRFLLQGPLLISASPRLFPHSFLLFLFFYLFPIVYVTLELRKTNQASLKRCSNKNDTF